MKDFVKWMAPGIAFLAAFLGPIVGLLAWAGGADGLRALGMAIVLIMGTMLLLIFAFAAFVLVEKAVR